MEGARFENSRAIGGAGAGAGAGAGGFGSGNSGRAMAVGSDAALKPLVATSIVDRFRAMVKEREEEVRVSEDDVVVLSSEEVVGIYEALLGELTSNSKPVITDLTIIAGDQREHGEGIADAICARIIEVPVEQKLPSLYLLDSIVKNIGKDYVRYFTARLPEVFCEAYRQVHPSMYNSMRHLFGTWSAVFPSAVLRKIETRLGFTQALNNQSSGGNSSRASVSPRSTHGIHVNLTYLEARRQFGDGTGELAGSEPLSSRGLAGPSASGFGAAKLLPSSGARIARSSSPYGLKNARSLSPPADTDASSQRAAKRASPSHPGFDYGYGRTGRHDDAAELQRNIFPDETNLKLETSAYRYSNGIDLQRPRALIDAYGMDDRLKSQKDKHPKVDPSNVNGIGKSASVKTWQNTEEEEFNWADMAPSSGDIGLGNDLLSLSGPPPGLGKRPGVGTYPDSALGVLDHNSNWSKHTQLTVPNGMTSGSEVSAIHSGDVNRRLPGLQNDTLSTQQHFSIQGNGRTPQVPFPGNGMLSSIKKEASLVGSFPSAEALIRRSPVASTFGPGFDPMSHETKPNVLDASVGVLTPAGMQASYPQAGVADSIKHENLGYHPETVGHHRMHMSNFLGQHLGGIESNSHMHIPRPPNQLHGNNHFQPQVRPHMNFMRPQMAHPSQEARQNMIAPLPFAAPSPSLRPTLSHGYVSQGHTPVHIGTGLSGPIPNVQSSMPAPGPANGSIHYPGGALPPHRPQGFPPAPQMLPPAGANPPAGSALSGLYGSLLAQGLISLGKDASVQDQVGLDFNPDVLKVRHEAAITALYADLPRQCTACGLRFKCQEAHRSHMDWHVTRNRNLSKNRKPKPSRKWFVNVDTWLSSAETLGVEAVSGISPADNTVEKNDDEEVAVPADDDQKFCALCGEPFDDFYCDETDEWMYRGAVYLNAPTGSTSGMDRSELGPIVHSKCRSETGGAPAQEEVGFNEEGSEWKRLRS